METILIRPNLLQLVKEGKKTSTCRNGIRNYPLGKTILKSNESDDFIFIDIKSLSYRKLKDITDDMAKADGFESRENLEKVMKDIYVGIDEESDITIVHFDKEKHE